MRLDSASVRVADFPSTEPLFSGVIRLGGASSISLANSPNGRNLAMDFSGAVIEELTSLFVGIEVLLSVSLSFVDSLTVTRGFVVGDSPETVEVEAFDCLGLSPRVAFPPIVENSLKVVLGKSLGYVQST